MLWIDQEVQYFAFNVGFTIDLCCILYGLCIVTIHWCRNGDRFLTIFTFGICQDACWEMRLRSHSFFKDNEHLHKVEIQISKTTM